MPCCAPSCRQGDTASHWCEQPEPAIAKPGNKAGAQQHMLPTENVLQLCVAALPCVGFAPPTPSPTASFSTSLGYPGPNMPTTHASLPMHFFSSHRVDTCSADETVSLPTLPCAQLHWLSAAAWRITKARMSDRGSSRGGDVRGIGGQRAVHKVTEATEQSRGTGSASNKRRTAGPGRVCGAAQASSTRRQWAAGRVPSCAAEPSRGASLVSFESGGGGREGRRSRAQRRCGKGSALCWS